MYFKTAFSRKKLSAIDPCGSPFAAIPRITFVGGHLIKPRANKNFARDGDVRMDKR